MSPKSRVSAAQRPCPQPSVRADALSKATGAERYALDLAPADCLFAGAFRPGAPSGSSPGIAHGRVRGLDTAAALAEPGVLRVLTAADVPGTNLQGIVHKDQPVLCGEVIRHAGDPVALVLAVSAEALRRGLAALRADIEPLPGVFDPAAALKKGAPLVHAQGHAAPKGGNLLLRAVIEKGDARKALRDAPVVVRGEFSTPAQEHAFLETQCGFAQVLPDGVLDMTVSTQAPFRDRFEIGHALGLDPFRIRVRAPYLGGGFGGKDGATVQCLLALAALKAEGRPVRMAWDREESILAGYKRHAVRLRCELGADSDGTLLAYSCRALYDTGAYAHLGGEVMELGMEHAAGPYRVPHTFVEGRCVYTNNPVAGAFRGFGVAQMSPAFEGLMDALAARLGMDPQALRRKNALRTGDTNSSGVTLTSSAHLAECLDALEAHPLWAGREAWREAAPPFIRRGVGVAAVFNGMGYGRGLPDMAIAKLELTGEGDFLVYSAVADMGQGNAAAFATLAAQELNQQPGAVRLLQPDTERCHPSGSSSAGRTTYTFGNALLKACAAMRDKLLSRAALFLLADDIAALELVPGAVRHKATDRMLPLAVLGRALERDDRVCVAEFLMPVAQDPPDTGRGFVIGFPHLFFAYAAHLARIEVDELTGRVRVCDYVCATDGGRVLDRSCFDQQAQGGAAQGIGFALTEDFSTRQGLILTGDLSTCLMPTALDLPDILSLAVEGDEPTGPRGLKGVGEVGLNGPAPALASALEDATGVRLRDFPLAPERVLAALKQRQGRARRKA
ncbi:MAG: xanthine dehydrogenase family protein molybdopterin-binding subunit [Humidesulfovibrio sp.]|uniref:xanthine dehydrogenase family protein molybdopterin-binding subunit n=1 Tax=Humidesulfovibrio sp. TaxID=2910988 RepID=UPI0027EE2003|nr:xanthine dehydrogenase family protein molybdopterin-binding subunit [Humidesulfovibrio sp.]MDQ7836123.1 xanthine dehydrogenase family protein molybdopterin-binding subunit [Humidesulfovibrio sp.]